MVAYNNFLSKGPTLGILDTNLELILCHPSFCELSSNLTNISYKLQCDPVVKWLINKFIVDKKLVDRLTDRSIKG